MPSWNDSFVPSFDEIEAARGPAYEETLVKQLLKYYGKSQYQRELLAGQDFLTFHAFMSQFGFPMWLVAKPIKDLSAETFLALRHRPTKTKLYETWQAAKEEVPADFADGRLGLVFRWTGWARFVVLHDCISRRDQGGPQLTLWVGSETLRLETLTDLLDDLGGPQAITD